MEEISALDIVIIKVLNIPHDYHSLQESPFNLVKQSGYFEVHDQVTETILAQALEKRPALIDEWMQYSEDQRTSEGQFLRIENSKNYVATFSTKNGYQETLTEYPNIQTACTAFIKGEIEFSRELAVTRNKKKKKK